MTEREEMISLVQLIFRGFEESNPDLLDQALHDDFDFDERYSFTGLPRAGLDPASKLSVKQQYIEMNIPTLQAMDISYSDWEYIVESPRIMVMANITFTPKAEVTQKWMTPLTISGGGMFEVKDGQIYRSTGFQDRLKQFLAWGEVQFEQSEKEAIRSYFEKLRAMGLVGELD